MKWVVITLIVLLAAAAACVLWAMQLAKHKFRCRHCGKEFTVNWTKLLFSVHAENEYEIKCPFCGKKGCMQED